MTGSRHSYHELVYWVENDEGLRDLYHSSNYPRIEWIKENLALIDEVIDSVKSGHESAHYLKYE